MSIPYRHKRTLKRIGTLLASLLVVLYYDPVLALIAFASTPSAVCFGGWEA